MNPIRIGDETLIRPILHNFRSFRAQTQTDSCTTLGRWYRSLPYRLPIQSLSRSGDSELITDQVVNAIFHGKKSRKREDTPFPPRYGSENNTVSCTRIRRHVDRTRLA